VLADLEYGVAGAVAARDDTDDDDAP